MGTALSGVKHIVASFFDFLFVGLTASPYLEDYYTRLSHGDRDFDDSFLWESAEGAAACGDIHRKYKDYFSHHTPRLQPPLQELSHEDVGLRADPAKPNLLRAPNAVIEEITPAIGTEIRGIQLSSFSPAQLNELALLVAERGVVIFKDQDFSEAGPEHWKK